MRRNKYNAKPTRYRGRRYDSEAEAGYARSLDLLLKNGDIAWWIPQVTILLGVPENTYRVDFLIGDDTIALWTSTVGVYAVDVKGCETAKFRRDCKLWETYGPFDLKIVKKGVVAEVIPGGGQE